MEDRERERARGRMNRKKKEGDSAKRGIRIRWMNWPIGDVHIGSVHAYHCKIQDAYRDKGSRSWLIGPSYLSGWMHWSISQFLCMGYEVPTMNWKDALDLVGLFSHTLHEVVDLELRVRPWSCASLPTSCWLHFGDHLWWPGAGLHISQQSLFGPCVLWSGHVSSILVMIWPSL